MSHHDFKVLPNGNVIMIVCEVKTLGRCPRRRIQYQPCVSAITTNGGFMLPDYIIEVQPTRPYGGNDCLGMARWDHLIQDYDPTKNNYGVVSNHVGLINANPPTGQNQQFWNHFNGIDYNPQLDQILISCRCNNEIWVIDHSTTTAQAAGHSGGPTAKAATCSIAGVIPSNTNSARKPTRCSGSSTAASGFRPTTPAPATSSFTTTVMVGRGYTSVDEIVPPVDAYGNYSRSAGAAFGPTNFYWTYTNNPATNFYCSDIGGAEREPNGNTLITYGTHGTLFEVTTNGTTVWSYINPETTTPLAQGSAIPPDPNMAGQWFNEVFKVHRYADQLRRLRRQRFDPTRHG